MYAALSIAGWSTKAHECKSQTHNRTSENTPRGFAIVTDTGDLWILEGCDPYGDLIGTQVAAEGVIADLDRLRTE